MPRITDFSTRGRVISKRDDNTIAFKPNGTNYELHVRPVAPYDGPLDEPIDALLRVSARKVYTVPSGGNFVAPIVGSSRIVQGRVRLIDGVYVVVHAGANFIVELPAGDSAIDLNNGAIVVGSMMNVVALPSATVEFVNAAAPTAH